MPVLKGLEEPTIHPLGNPVLDTAPLVTARGRGQLSLLVLGQDFPLECRIIRAVLVLFLLGAGGAHDVDVWVCGCPFVCLSAWMFECMDARMV